MVAIPKKFRRVHLVAHSLLATTLRKLDSSPSLLTIVCIAVSLGIVLAIAMFGIQCGARP